jgi:hypothetical protein
LVQQAAVNAANLAVQNREEGCSEALARRDDSRLRTALLERDVINEAIEAARIVYESAENAYHTAIASQGRSSYTHLT